MIESGFPDTMLPLKRHIINAALTSKIDLE